MRLPGCEDSDGESGEHWKREWWRDRNERVMTRAGVEMDSLDEVKNDVKLKKKRYRTSNIKGHWPP